MEQKRDFTNREQNVLSIISFRQKSTALSLIITGSAAAYYVANMWPMRPEALADDVIPAGYGGLVLTTVALIIVTQIVLQIVLLFGSGSDPAATVNTAPVEHGPALEAVDAPMLVVVGSDDEAFVADAFPAAIGEFNDGEVHIVDGETHGSIVESTTAMTHIERWLESTQLRKMS